MGSEMYEGKALLTQVLGGGPSIRSQKEALDAVIERLDREIVAAQSAASKAPTVLSEEIFENMPRCLTLSARLSNGNVLVVEWMDQISATGLLIETPEEHPRPCVDAEVGLPLEVLQRMRAEVTTLAEEWREERRREDEAYDDGHAVWPPGGCP